MLSHYLCNRSLHIISISCCQLTLLSGIAGPTTGDNGSCCCCCGWWWCCRGRVWSCIGCCWCCCCCWGGMNVVSGVGLGFWMAGRSWNTNLRSSSSSRGFSSNWTNSSYWNQFWKWLWNTLWWPNHNYLFPHWFNESKTSSILDVAIISWKKLQVVKINFKSY